MTKTLSFGLSLGMYLWTGEGLCVPAEFWGSGRARSGALYEEVPRALHSCAKLSTREGDHMAPDRMPPSTFRGAATTCMETAGGPQEVSQD